ncbi:hypothetical protein [Amycolatopsis sp. CA-230715]|uniref:hypothetical protein n=1 Tax=Amycolatopsis sp. CA-230715 TaxID=2745196 RepID=UPI001C017EC0|nr:hypothetical protein [Amycolatopsis sp. CA-230715]QWF82296.1 hypothetical protein HUW46_05733 [Amycolatopsis sp. CA-230715]
MSHDPGQGYPGGPRPGQPYGQQPQYGPPSGPIPGPQSHPGQHWPPPPRPENPWDQYRAQQAPPPGGGNKRKLGLMFGIGIPIIAVIVLVVVLVARAPDRSPGGGGETVNAAGEKDLGSGSPTDPAGAGVYWPAGPLKQYPAAPQGFTPGAAPSDEAIAAVDPRQLYWSMLKNQSTKTVTDYIHQTWRTPYDYKTNYPANSLTSRVAVDYQSRKFIDEFTAVEADGSRKKPDLIRCVDNATRSYSDYFHGWQPPKQDSRDKCANRMQPGKFVDNSYTSDGVAAGGLSQEDADKFISYLDGIPGLFTMAKPTKAQGKDGKTYLQLDVTLAPQPLVKPGREKEFHPSLDRKMGVGFLEAAFRQTGKKPGDYPYSIDIGATEGRQMRYFIDPATLLPAYSVTMTIIPQFLDGRQVGEGFSNAYSLFEYSFPQQLEEAAMKAEGVPTFPFRPFPFDQVILK